MDNQKTKTSLILLTIFIFVYVSLMKPSSFIYIFLGLCFLIMLKNTNIIQSRLLPPVILIFLLLFIGLFYINQKKHGKVEKFNTQNKNKHYRKVERLTLNPMEEKINELEAKISKLENIKQTDNNEFNLHKNKQNLEFQDKAYKTQSIMNELVKTKGSGSKLSEKNLRLLKKNVVETFSQIVTETQDSFQKIQKNRKLAGNGTSINGIYTTFLLILKSFMESVSKENRMIYVGIIFMLFSLAFTFIDIGL
jgi:hypothetical protein